MTTMEPVTDYLYDAVPYPSYPFPQTHPNRLATIATLLGMEPAPVGHCRILELGCARGGNLIPMAQQLPESEFVGIDLAASQVAQGQKMIRAVGLQNISLEVRDILAVGPELGQFDYIIAHGVYSWVPPAAQEKMLAICRENLAPNGVAYISYNTYPGWRLHGTIRDMMRYHIQDKTDPREQIAGAQEILDFVADWALGDSTPIASFLHSYANYARERIQKQGDPAYMFHNELSPINEPVYFYQFAARAARHGLRYLGEAQFQSMLATNLPPEAAQALRRMADNTIAVEQYMDFLRNRLFRQTLLCHQQVQLQSKLTMERLVKFHMASAVLPAAAEPDIRSEAVGEFRGPNEKSFSTNHPVTKAALLYLSTVWPQAVPFKDLLAAAYARVYDLPADQAPSADLNTEAQLLGANLVKAYSISDDLIEFHRYPLPFVRAVSQYPEISPTARYQARLESRVTNQRHELLDLTAIAWQLAPYLDGTRDQAALRQILTELVEQGVVELKEEDRPLKTPAEIKQAVPEALESALQAMANAALLIG
jgi:methyltransferase-like protein/predicted O-methyltransferase YrrM